jgi:hypothetical protein
MENENGSISSAKQEQISNPYDTYMNQLLANFKEASMQRHRLQMENAWPGRYHAEVTLGRESQQKALGTGVVGGLVVHIGAPCPLPAARCPLPAALSAMHCRPLPPVFPAGRSAHRHVRPETLVDTRQA